MKRRIIGITVGSPLPKPNLMQDDPSKGDYVKGKEEFLQENDITEQVYRAEAAATGAEEAAANAKSSEQNAQNSASRAEEAEAMADGYAIIAYENRLTAEHNAKQAEESATTAEESASRSEAAAAAAETSAAEAKASEQLVSELLISTEHNARNAEESRFHAEGYAFEAENSASRAEESATGAETSAAAAKASEQNAQNSASGAKTAETGAKEAAEESMWSALSAQKFSKSAETAATRAEEAADRAENAGQGSGGGASTWEDLGSKYEVSTILAECSPPFVGADVAGMDMFVFSEAFPLTEGKEYTVSWNGTPYTCICARMAMGTLTGLGLGNIGMLTGGANTGEPFVLGVFDQYDGFAPAAAVPLDGSTTLTISIKTILEHITPLPAKYLPRNGILYAGSDDILYKTADTDSRENRLLSWELKDMMEQGIPVCLHIVDDEGNEKLRYPYEIRFVDIPEWGGLIGWVEIYNHTTQGDIITHWVALPNKDVLSEDN